LSGEFGKSQQQEETMEDITQKQAAVSFLKLAASGKLDEAYGTYIAENFRHHNAYFPGDAESLKAGMAGAHKQFPNTRLDIQRVIAESNLVAVHSRVEHGPDTTPIAVVHIFRFEGDRIAELWDVGMEVPKDSPNKNGAF
jgi:predicted SnoaL-like aldol condensation-catalyzing enzyme